MPNYNSTLQSNNTSLEEIITQLNNMPDAGDSEPTLQDKTVTPTTSKQTITADSGYDGLDTVTVNAMPTATQATPSVSVNSSTGLVTATATQTAGYVSAGSKSGTLQLAFQAAKTITPGTTNQTAVSSGYYTGGAITVKGDANLVAENIVSGKSIFGVVGTATTGGSSSGDTSMEDSLVTRNITTYTNDRVTSIGDCAFYSYSRLKNVSFPACKSIGAYAFYGCTKLINVNFPVCSYVGSYAFRVCKSLTTADFPNVTTVASYAFKDCYFLTTANFPKATVVEPSAFEMCSNLSTINFPNVVSISTFAFGYCDNKLTTVSFPNIKFLYGSAFQGCTLLSEIYLMSTSVCKLSSKTAFTGTGIWSDKGAIYVPPSLVASYKAATNWTFFSNRIYSYNHTGAGE